MKVSTVDEQASTVTHVLHVVHKFAAGGLENVIVQLVNGLTGPCYRHTILAMTTIDEVFASRIQNPQVQLHALNKGPGQPFKLYPQIYRLMQSIKPDVVHTCNLGALELMPVAAAVGVPMRIHVEHGWDVSDPQGKNQKFKWLRRFYNLFTHRCVAVSPDLQDYLLHTVRLRPERVELIANGVDTELFRPRHVASSWPDDCPFKYENDCMVVGTVGRLAPIKNQILLAKAFIKLLKTNPSYAARLRLALIGEGSEREKIETLLRQAGVMERVWMPGTRNDIPQIMQMLDCFVLPSLAEGTSCTLQEAMACGLPIVATAVGGTPDLLNSTELGCLVRSDDVEHMAQAMGSLLSRHEHGVIVNERARDLAASSYSLKSMQARYAALFTNKRAAIP